LHIATPVHFDRFYLSTTLFVAAIYTKIVLATGIYPILFFIAFSEFLFAPGESFGKLMQQMKHETIIESDMAKLVTCQ
jgi:hypothetical protein